MTTPTGIAPTTPTATRLARAVTLRCPECGGGPIFSRWVKLAARCPRCALKLDRGHTDHFLGAYVVNLIVAELLVVVGLAWGVLATWPDVPWAAIQWVGVAGVLLAPLATYPFARTVWLAADLIFDPLKEEDR